MSDLPTSGRLGYLTAAQEEVLKDFKKQANSYDEKIHSDHLLLRFCRARKFHLVNTLKMWNDYVVWRQENKVDALVDTFQFPEFPIIKKFYPRFFHKLDKLGRPVYYEQMGFLDVKQMFAVTTQERMADSVIAEYEKNENYRFPACSLKAGVHIEQSCSILDLKGVPLTSFSSVFGLVQKVSIINLD